MSDQYLNSSYNYQKVAVEGTGSASIVNSVNFTDITIPHNLGYISSVRVWYDSGSGRRFPLSEEDYTSDDTFVSEVNLVTTRAYLTTTNLVIQIRNVSGSTRTVSYWYKVYYDA